MEPTKVLMEEHAVIKRALHSLEKAAYSLRAGRAVRAGYFLDAARFIREYADITHHNKEEGILFPAMEMAGIPSEMGPIGVMLAEHQEGRLLTTTMRLAAERLQAGDASAKNDVVQNAMGFVMLLRQHIEKEDGILYPMAVQAIHGSDYDRLVAAFDAAMRKEAEGNVQEKYIALAESLERETIL